MKYDVIVIGGGTAGLGAYRKAKLLGKKALIIEANDFVTTCANVGCMPSKLLIAAAENMVEINKSSQFGIEVGDIKINQEVLWKRIQNERDRFVGFVKEGADNIEAGDKIIGYAKIRNQNEVEVNGQILKTNAIVIATGSRPFIPALFDEIKSEILTNENIFEQTQLPSSVAVFGAGVIGLELGYALKNLGVEVSLFNRSNKILNLGQSVNDYAIKEIQENFDFIYEDIATKIEKENKNGIAGYTIYYGNKIKWVEKILVTAGRRANIDNIGLDNIEELNNKEILNNNIINGYNQLTTQLYDLPIFLAGDVNNEVTLLHEAAKEGVIAGINAASYPLVLEQDRNIFMGIVFSHPQIMQVGNTDKLPEDVIVGEVSFDDQGRSRVMLKNKGVLNVYIDKETHLLIGAEMIGPDAEHVAHLLAWLIEKNTTLEETLQLPYYHPVIEEGIRTAMRNAFSKITNL